MACVTESGKISEQTKKLLLLLRDTISPADVLAETLDAPFFKIRASLRQMKEAGFIHETEQGYTITNKGLEVLHLQDA
ncbi:MAG: hypothetical protein BSOLF_1373 [Candidatus Carbobacillus altaicus]|uniref:ArnR1-like winged helix-turn-helix domain-containing protein n=1 Tax=Candidatus Carbonibacillus altaicus TaxID=2163959 RepID=A0A2R6Y4C2_9BACL|nr:MAG: hypothetical protein BSOLF_1373 [Candidatus Carbobacillus altaicus]